MTFSPVTGDNPFNPGSNFSASIAIRDSFDFDNALGISYAPFIGSPVWPTGYSSVFGGLFEYAANGDVTVKSTGGSSSRPTSGLVYPRLV
jgi:hypothetical protein